MEYIVTTASRVNNGKSSQTEIHLIESKSSQYNDFPLYYTYTISDIHNYRNTQGIITLSLPDVNPQKKNTLSDVFDILRNIICNDPIYSESVPTNVYKW